MKKLLLIIYKVLNVIQIILGILYLEILINNTFLTGELPVLGENDSGLGIFILLGGAFWLIVGIIILLELVLILFKYKTYYFISITLLWLLVSLMNIIFFKIINDTYIFNIFLIFLNLKAVLSIFFIDSYLINNNPKK